MTDKTIDLDHRRGMEAQKATDLRRLLAEVEANERALRLRQDELEAHLADAPAASWEEAAEKARYVLGLYKDVDRRRHAPANAGRGSAGGSGAPRQRTTLTKVSCQLDPDMPPYACAYESESQLLANCRLRSADRQGQPTRPYGPSVLCSLA
jgi:hypothetical protein